VRRELGRRAEDRDCHRGRHARLQAERGEPPRPADDDRALHLLERCSPKIGRDPRHVGVVLAAVGAAAEVRVQHARLELRELAVEAKRDLRANTVADDCPGYSAHDGIDVKKPGELGAEGLRAAMAG